MTAADVPVLVAVGVFAGVISSVAGLASAFSYPALIALGLPPLSANVTNTVALMFTGVGATIGSRPELAGQGGLVRRIGAVTVLGGAAGAAVLLLTPSSAFEAIAPWLIGVASLMLLLNVKVARSVKGAHGGRAHGLRAAALFCVAIYIGYFGAAGGVLMLAVLAAMLDRPLAQLTAVRNVVAGLANCVAAVGFAIFGPVVWSAALPLAAGFLAGGWLGPGLVRRLPERALRVAIGVSGVLVAIKLGVDTYR